MSSEQEWRDSLSIGDEIAIREDGRYSIHKIEHVTAKQIETKYHKFSRRNGHAFNDNRCATICPVTPELKRDIEDAFERKKLRGVISLALPTTSAETLRAMVKVLHAAEEAAETREQTGRWRPGMGIRP